MQTAVDTCQCLYGICGLDNSYTVKWVKEQISYNIRSLVLTTQNCYDIHQDCRKMSDSCLHQRSFPTPLCFVFKCKEIVDILIKTFKDILQRFYSTNKEEDFLLCYNNNSVLEPNGKFSWFFVGNVLGFHGLNSTNYKLRKSGKPGEHSPATIFKSGSRC